MRNMIKYVMGVVMFLFAGLTSFGAAVMDGLACAACSQHMCMIHTSGHKNFKQYVQADRPDQIQNDVKDKVDKIKEKDNQRKPDGVPPEILKQFDVNKDGKLCKQERLAAFKFRINKDGKLKKRLLEKFDVDKNGELSDTELEKALEDTPNRPGHKTHNPDDVQIVSPSEPKPVPPVVK